MLTNISFIDKKLHHEQWIKYTIQHFLRHMLLRFMLGYPIVFFFFNNALTEPKSFWKRKWIFEITIKNQFMNVLIFLEHPVYLLPYSTDLNRYHLRVECLYTLIYIYIYTSSPNIQNNLHTYYSNKLLKEKKK